MIRNLDIAIIGGGASGLMAAIHAGTENPELKIAVFDVNPRIGRRLLATGNGRCNFTNMNVRAEDYAPHEKFVADALSYTSSDLRQFFSGLALLSYADEMGRVYPATNQSSSVLDALRFEVERLHITVVTEARITTLQKEDDHFILNKNIFAKSVIVATGNKASPNLSSSSNGFQLLTRLGHKVTSLYPALTGFNAHGAVFKSLHGVRVGAHITLVINGCETCSEVGEIQFTDYGVSGIGIMQLSRIYAQHLKSEVYAKTSLIVDYLPNYSHDELSAIITSFIKKNPSLRLESLLNGFVSKNLGHVLLREAGATSLSAEIGTLHENMVENIIRMLKHHTIYVKSLRDMQWAQIAVGGVNCQEFSPKTLESTIIQGLFCCGEVLDVDGACGGLNLHWAFASGKLAGENAVSCALKLKE